MIDLDRHYGQATWIGGGGFGDVYLVGHEGLDQNTALKVLGRQYVNDREIVGRFKLEARSVASFDHPNIVRAYHAGQGIFQGDRVSYIAMEYVPGGTLKERIQKEGSLPTPTAVAIALQVARALGAVHEREVIHRDIKPQNVLLTKDGKAKVTDFGIAWARSATRITGGHQILGTSGYMSPEHARGEPVGPESDLYALGVMLYEMLTGELPHDAETPVGIDMKYVNGSLRAPKEINPNIPEDINAVTVRLLAHYPKDRYRSAAKLIEDLERIGQVKDEPDVIEGGTRATKPDLERRRGVLAGAYLSLGGQKEATSETVPEGEIIEQDPPAGTEVETDSSVSVTVGSGPQEMAAPVPDGLGGSHRRGRDPSSMSPAKAGSPTEEKQRVPSEKDSPGQTARRSATRSGRRIGLLVGLGILLHAVMVGLVGDHLTDSPPSGSEPGGEAKDESESKAGAVPGSEAEAESKPKANTGPETGNFTLTNTLTGHSNRINSVAFSPNGNLLASGDGDDTVKLWDPKSGELLQTLTGPPRGDDPVAFSPDGKLLASGDDRGRINIWERG